MRNLLVLVALGTLAWYGYEKQNATIFSVADRSAVADLRDSRTSRPTPETPVVPSSPQFTCDGRQYCSQMRSCAEATYFLQHCPTVKMDGDGDGVPCERQWCR